MYAFANRCVLLLFITAVGLTSAVTQAQEPASEGQQEPVLEIKEIVVSTSRLPSVEESIYAVPSKVTIITAEEIEQSGAKTVQEAVQHATGIVMFNEVGNAFEQRIDLRGFNGQPVPSTSVFVDGTRVNNPDFNGINFDLIPLETIERIEIQPGPSAIYGKNAIGGVINIITKSGTEQHQMTVETMFGSYQRELYNTNISGPIGELNYYANFAREIEKGYRNEAAGRISRFFGKLGYQPSNTTDISVSYTYVKDRLQQAGSLPLSEAAINPRSNFTPGDFFKRENNSVKINGRRTFATGLTLAANASYRKLLQQGFVVGQTSQTDNVTNIESWSSTVQLTHDWDIGRHRNVLSLGGEVTRNEFGAEFFGFFFCCPGSPTITRTSTDEDILALYAQDTFHLGPWLILSTGVRYDHDQLSFTDKTAPMNNASRRFNRTTPRAGLTYLVAPTTSLYINYSEGFRTPTVNELFTSTGAFGTSDPDLSPVRSRNYELGFKAQIGTWSEVALALFQSDVRNEILFVCGDPACSFPSGIATNQNVDKTRRRGIELTLKGKYNQYLDGILNYSFTEATFQTDLTLNPFFPFVENVQKGDSFPLVPKHRLSLWGNYRPIPGLTISLGGLYVSTQFLLSDEENAQERLPGYLVLNGRISYEQPVPGGRLEGFLTLNNILDREYYTSGIIFPNAKTGGGAVERFLVPAPTIAIYGGLSYRFESFSR